MAIVSISEAARLTKKSRTTIHRYIKTGKLSMCSDSEHKQGIDISELIRVFGEIQNVLNEHNENETNEQNETTIITHKDQRKIEHLSQENEQLKKQIELLHDHVSSLKQAMLLLEYKNNSTPVTKSSVVKKRWWKIFSN